MVLSYSAHPKIENTAIADAAFMMRERNSFMCPRSGIFPSEDLATIRL